MPKNANDNVGFRLNIGGLALLCAPFVLWGLIALFIYYISRRS